MEHIHEMLLVDAGPNRVEVMALLRRLDRLSLREVKDLVNSLPAVVGFGTVQNLYLITKQLEQLGAIVEFRCLRKT